MNRVFLALILGIVFCGQAVGAEEHLKLDKTTILGNGELPKVTFVVPWRDVPSMIPESKPSPVAHPHTTPLDRDLYQRQIEYLQQLKQRKADAAAR
jgi:hypothetical protein